ncbi:alpha/beta hydrolase [Microbacterium sp. ET2]|uniref:alpha/beta hydrolase n=1 Tax=Microbacterium albipurpureum TaxID=3050384 RepID=UPI00259CB03C|nr:alpha/beta hydrolase [Microbacterium sp. ET2 (Ac-2212)]WJL96272.1 alpha/beta hydrolase [Microbacterium sp. ET2 (Ac-2212)]
MPPIPPFDPDVAHALATNPDVVTTLRPDEIAALRTRSVVPSREEITRSGRLEHSEHMIDGPGGDLRIVLLLPAARTAPVPVLLFAHGGGLVVGGPYDGMVPLAALAAEAGFAIASVDYRLAPEHRYPAAVEDVYAALGWVARQAATLDVDPDRIILTGISAGGGLAAATALLARDRGGPGVFAQLLVCPMLDDRNQTGSGTQMAGRGAWDRDANETAWSAYLGPDRTEVPIYAAPARAEDLSGLPPAFIDVGSAETFRDECVAYADRIWQSGGDAELHVWPGGAHGFDALVPDALLSRDAARARAHWLARVLAHGRRALAGI